MERVLRLLIADIMIFAYCQDAEIDPDFAVAQLERHAAEIAQWPQELLSLFRMEVQDASRQAREQGNQEDADRLDLLPEHLGI